MKVNVSFFLTLAVKVVEGGNAHLGVAVAREPWPKWAVLRYPLGAAGSLGRELGSTLSEPYREMLQRKPSASRARRPPQLAMRNPIDYCVWRCDFVRHHIQEKAGGLEGMSGQVSREGVGLILELPW